MSSVEQSHFLFVAGALRERSSLESANIQLSHGIWGIRTALIRDNLSSYLSSESRGLVYVLKAGVCAGFRIAGTVQPTAALSEFVRDELRAETAYGFLPVTDIRTWASSADESLVLLRKILAIPESTELTRRLNLGMHRLTVQEYEALTAAMTPKSF